MSSTHPIKHFHLYLCIHLGHQKTISYLGPCLEKYKLWINLYNLFITAIKGRAKKMPIQCCICIKIIVEDTVICIAHFSSTQWHTLHLSFRLQYWLKVCSPWNSGVLPPFWKGESPNCVCYPQNSKSNLNFSYNSHVDHYDIHTFFISLNLISKFCLYVISLYGCWFVVAFISGYQCFVESIIICIWLNTSH